MSASSPIENSANACGRDRSRLALDSRAARRALPSNHFMGKAASKVFVELMALVVGIVLGIPDRVSAQARQESRSSAPFEITDNSFFVEEAFNQEARIFQNIFGWTRDDTGAWAGSFTQEWPLGGMTHQFSYTLPFSGGDTSTHLDSVLLNYRYQVVTEGPGRLAFAPRFSVMMPSGRESTATRRPGLQLNLPFSKRLRDVYVHWNGGVTWVHRVPLSDGRSEGLTSPSAAASLIWRAKPMFHLMLETMLEWEESLEEHGTTSRQGLLTLSPGFRGGWDIGDTQVVLGLAMPVSKGSNDTSVGVLTYFSYELPFAKQP